MLCLSGLTIFSLGAPVSLQKQGLINSSYVVSVAIYH